ncbi:MAG: YggS family pyridoxal phosphate-dependent enzyme [Kiritimatiellota bacterium]|nr:YggS family pyridoxal phosphate-dependent enzyme [Kiritimatiellota bacterium]
MTPSFEDNFAEVRRRIQAACDRAGRCPEEVRVLAVSKTHGPECVQEAAACGLTFFGESRVQEAKQKIPLCPTALTWHLIGHLQTNKVKDAVNLFHLIQAVDSLKLLLAIETAAETAGRVMPVFLEVNVSGESSKFGLAPEAVPGILQAANGLRRVEIRGLLTMPPLAEDPEHARPFFRTLREHRDRWRQETGFELRELSMGMSHDFEVAVEEGATWIRLGSILFGKRHTL